MSFLQSISSFFKRYAVFSGRSSRSEYNYIKLFMILYSIGISIFTVLVTALMSIIGAAALGAISVSIFSVLFGIFLIVPTLSLFVRRLHDLNLSGWWLLLWPLFAIPVMAFGFVSVELSILMNVVVVLFSIVFDLLLMCIRGTTGPNRFGPDPLVPVELKQTLAPAAE